MPDTPDTTTQTAPAKDPAPDEVLPQILPESRKPATEAKADETIPGGLFYVGGRLVNCNGDPIDSTGAPVKP